MSDWDCDWVGPWDRTEPEIHLVGGRKTIQRQGYGKSGRFWPDKYVCKCGCETFYIGGDHYQYSTKIQCAKCNRIDEVHSG